MFPLKDFNGANAHRGQDQPNQNEQRDHVFFAAGTWEGDPSGAVRTVQLDHNLSILAPVINAAISREEHPAEFDPNPSDQDLMDRAIAVIDNAEGVVVIQRTNPLGEVEVLTTQALDRVTLPAPEPLGLAQGMWAGVLPGGPIRAACDGLYIFLRPLVVGDYTLTVSGTAPRFGGGQFQLFRTNVTYALRVT